MNLKKTKELLVAEHLERSLHIIDDIMERYHSLDVKKVKDTFAVFYTQNAHNIVSGFAKSSTDALHEAINSGLNIDNDFLQSLQNTNATASLAWKAAVENTYNNLPVE